MIIQTPEQKKERQRQYYLKNRDKIIERAKIHGRKQRLENWEYRREIEKKSYQNSKQRPAADGIGTAYQRKLGDSKKYYRRTFIQKMLYSAKDRAKQRGLEFDLTQNDIVIPTHCPILGLPLAVTPEGSIERRQENAPSLDRIDNARGYTKDNICVISWRANRMKNGWSLEELKQLVAWMKLKQNNTRDLLM